MSNLLEQIKAFADEVIERAQRNIGSTRTVTDAKGRKKKRRADSTGKLRNNLAYRIKDTGDSFTLEFFANGKAGAYAAFVEYGVNGTQKKHGSPFSFRGKNINQSAILQWMKDKPVRVREFKDGKLGGFTKATETKKRQSAFLIGRSIAKSGIAPLNYFSDAIQDTLPEFEQSFADAVAQDLADRLG